MKTPRSMGGFNKVLIAGTVERGPKWNGKRLAGLDLGHEPGGVRHIGLEGLPDVVPDGTRILVDGSLSIIDGRATITVKTWYPTTQRGRS